MEYKTSSEAKRRSEINKANAKKKKYHHVTGPGGYKSHRPKWEKAETELINKGIIPETWDWTERTKSWFYGVGGKLDPETGCCIYTRAHIEEPGEALKTAHKEVREGKFHPDRENDELTRALGNPEHSGRTQGTPGSLPWKFGFRDEQKDAVVLAGLAQLPGAEQAIGVGLDRLPAKAVDGGDHDLVRGLGLEGGEFLHQRGFRCRVDDAGIVDDAPGQGGKVGGEGRGWDVEK